MATKRGKTQPQQQQTKRKLEFPDSDDEEEDILEQSAVALTQEVLSRKLNVTADTTPKSKERKKEKKKKKKDRAHSRKMEKNMEDGKKVSGKKKRRPDKERPLPDRINTYGRRRELSFTAEFLAMLRLVFQKDIEKKFISKKRIKDVLRRNPAFQRICKQMELSVENVRSRIRIMIKQA